jgi:hypothetical protein
MLHSTNALQMALIGGKISAPSILVYLVLLLLLYVPATLFSTTKFNTFVVSLLCRMQDVRIRRLSEEADRLREERKSWQERASLQASRIDNLHAFLAFIDNSTAETIYTARSSVLGDVDSSDNLPAEAKPAEGKPAPPSKKSLKEARGVGREDTEKKEAVKNVMQASVH